MNESSNLGTVVEFVASVEFEDGETIVFTPSRPSKVEAIAIGWAYFEAAGNDAQMDAYLDELGPVLVRRSLQAFANYAKRNGHADVAKFANELRDDIQVVRDGSSDAEQAS